MKIKPKSNPRAKWFKQQFGRLPGDLKGLEERVDTLTFQLVEARRALEGENIRHAQFRAASYVWDMSDTDKKKDKW